MVLFLIGLPTTVVLSVAANLLTPVLRNAWAARSTARRDTRIAKIREDAAFIEHLRAQPSAAAAYVSRQVIRVVFASACAAMLIAAALVLLTQTLTGETVLISVAGLVMFMVATFRVSRAQDFCHRIYDPQWHASETAAQLRKLGVEPEANPEH